MSRRLYDLAGADPNRRFSPYCWRTKLALAHKDLSYESIPWRFTDKDVIAFSGQGRVPVLVDDDKVVVDSWNIATYLEDTYSERASLFDGDGGRAATRFANAWTDGVVNPAIARMLVTDIFNQIDVKDRAYFRQTREARFGNRLEEVSADRETQVLTFRKSLEPLRTVLATTTYLGGAQPSYIDYIVFGSFQWARCISEFALLLEDDPMWAWRERLLSAFGGLARAALSYQA